MQRIVYLELFVAALWSGSAPEEVYLLSYLSGQRYLLSSSSISQFLLASRWILQNISLQEHPEMNLWSSEKEEPRVFASWSQILRGTNKPTTSSAQKPNKTHLLRTIEASVIISFIRNITYLLTRRGPILQSYDFHKINTIKFQITK